MLTLVDSTELNVSVLPGRLVLCKLGSSGEDGTNKLLVSCVGATSANKVFIQQSGHHQEGEIQYLNMDQEVTAVHEFKCGTSDHGSIVLGTISHLLVYNIHENKTTMTKEIENGVGSMVVGPYGDANEITIIVGGNCFLQCFKINGDEQFWNVMSDQVTALALVSCDGHNQLVTGTEDGLLRIFKNDRLVGEMKETDAITALIALSDHCFAYALINGTVGVYQKRTRLWRVKSKNQIVALSAYDVDNDGELELICAWSHGRFDARHWQTGEVVFKEKLEPTGPVAKERASIAALAVEDWLKLGHPQLIVCTRLGQLRSYLSSELELNVVDRIKEEAEEDTIRRLLIHKQNLLAQIEQLNVRPTTSKSSSKPTDSQIPISKSLLMELKHDDHNVILSVQSDSSAQRCAILSIVVFAEGIFPNGESHAVQLDPNTFSAQLVLPIQRHSSVEMHVHAFIDSSSSDGESLHVVESIVPLPTFSRFKPVPVVSYNPRFRVKFRIQERLQRIIFWIEQNFLLFPDWSASRSQEPPIELAFEVLPDRFPVKITLASLDGWLSIDSERLDAAAELIQHLSGFLNVQQLSSEIEVSDAALRDLVELTNSVRELQTVRQRLTVDMANQVSEVRNLFADAEAARLMGDTAELRRCYAAMAGGNRDLAGQQGLRQSNYSQLMDCLRSVNLHVQHAASCRVGKYQSDVIQACRHAIKVEDFDELVKITLNGVN